jgi:hypothetical protein
MDDQWVCVSARAETTDSMENHSAGGWYEDASRRQVLPGASSTSASRIPGAASPGPQPDPYPPHLPMTHAPFPNAGPGKQIPFSNCGSITPTG